MTLMERYSKTFNKLVMEPTTDWEEKVAHQAAFIS